MVTPPRPRPTGAAIEEHDVLVGGRTLRVVRRPASGPGARRTPLLLCNGIGAATDVLDPLVEALPADLDIIRFDPPGIGGSPMPRMPYHLSWLAHRVGQVLTKLGVREADVLGFSWGGMLAQQLAISRRRRVRKLVLAATGPGALMIPASPRVMRVLSSPKRHQDPAYVDAVAPRLYGGSLRHHPERAAEVLRSGTQRGPMRGYHYQLLALSGWTSVPLLSTITADTLIIAGDDDPMIPRGNATMLQRGIRRSRIHRHPGGHLDMLLEPEPFTAEIDRFLAS